MIDFKTELSKYKPAMDVDDLQESLNLNEVQDILDLMQQLAGKNGGKE